MNDALRVLIVDDTKVNIDILVEILGPLYDLSVAMNGETALALAKKNPPDLILLDIMMPIMDGYTTLKAIKDDSNLTNIPVILISALSDVSNKTLGFQLGAVDYIVKPFNIEEVLARVNTHLTLALSKKALENQKDLLEFKVQERTKEILLTQQATIMSFATLAEYRDLETGAHIQRLKEHVEHLAKSLKRMNAYSDILTDAYIDVLVQSSPLHDIGKVGVPDAILKKQGKLTPEEYEAIKLHTLYGFQAIESVEKQLGELPFLHLAKEVALTHHERYDGRGYPYGLKGESIPLSGRILALADVYDALVSKRVYKPPFSHQKSVSIILEGAGTQFDPLVVEAFMAVIEDIRKTAYAQADSEEEALGLITPYSPHV